jgi:ribosomal protein S16
VREGNKGRELEYEELRYEDWMEEGARNTKVARKLGSQEERKGD